MAASEERPGELIMASVYRPNGRTIYRIEFQDQHGKPRTISSGTDDKGIAESLGQKIEEDADRIRVGIAPKFPEISGPYLGLVPLERRGCRTWVEASREYLEELVRRGSPAGGAHYDGTVGTVLPIQKVRLLMRHMTLGMTADLYADLEMEGVTEEDWDLPPLFKPATGMENKCQ
jgi:hypothetical protein